MPAKLKSDSRLAIAHVLFIDVVGYSKLLRNEQREVVQQLNGIVRKTRQFRKSEAVSNLIRIPMGDGMALVFFQTPEEPVRCALEIARALKNYPHVRLRMGIHSGPVDQLRDVNDRLNVAGPGINVAKRVMDCGDAGHILLSKRVAEDLAHDAYWRARLHELGEVELKHGEKLVIVNLYTQQVGNSKPPLKFTTISPVMPHKSIAVLPFENLSADRENAFFALGMQDQILTDLAKIADLKVTSRTSVRQYETGVKRNIREIANALGVAHVVEGSVQRSGNRVRFRAQLIDAKTDTHMWAECYDRPLDDVFAIQSEVARAVADQLRAKLTPAEEAAIQQRPTDDLGAYDCYIRAKTLLAISSNAHQQENVFLAVRLLEDAVARDKAFFLAYCKLAYAHEQLYYAGFDHTASRLTLAKEALQRALDLEPGRGEAHLTAAWIHYQCYFDYDRARSELAIARNALPNEPEVFALAGYMDRRQGRWGEHIRNLERAAQLDPRNIEILKNLAQGYQLLRRFSAMAAVLDRMLAIIPADSLTRVTRASVDLHWNSDTGPLHATIRDVLAADPNAGPVIADQWFDLALCKRDSAETARALTSIPLHGVTPYCVRLCRAFYEGFAARVHGDMQSANASFTTARSEIAGVLRRQPDYPEALCLLGLIDACLGRKGDALREAKHAVELQPNEKDPLARAELIKYLAAVYAWTGEKQAALDQLEVALQMPCPISQGELRLHPYWDPLRGDAYFDKLVAQSGTPVAIDLT
jgi:TolB-like protein/class 3 adenylate cyclase/Tfp pilus assembly protein PilF